MRNGAGVVVARRWGSRRISAGFFVWLIAIMSGVLPVAEGLHPHVHRHGLALHADGDHDHGTESGDTCPLLLAAQSPLAVPNADLPGLSLTTDRLSFCLTIGVARNADCWLPTLPRGPPTLV